MENHVVVSNVKTGSPENGFSSPLIEQSVDMGFFENFIFGSNNDKKYFQNGCQRVLHCSCDCNNCAGIIG